MQYYIKELGEKVTVTVIILSEVNKHLYSYMINFIFISLSLSTRLRYIEFPF